MAFSAQRAADFLKTYLKAMTSGAARPELTTLFLGWMGTVPPRLILQQYLAFRAGLRQEKLDHQINHLEDSESELSKLLETAVLSYSDADLKEIKVNHFIVEREFPQIKTNSDDDIAAYYHARNQKDLSRAKAIYQRLITKYGDTEGRITLLRLWRTKSPLFLPVFIDLKNDLGGRLAANVRQSILHILRCFTEDNTTSALGLFNRIKRAVAILPADRTAAVFQLRKLQQYAEQLEFHTPDFDSVCEVLEDYFGDTLLGRREVKLVLPESVDDAAKAPATTVQTFNFAQVRFSPEDLKLITINPTIQGIENQVLAYCYQYWSLAQNSDFENKVYLYSVRFRGPQLSILQIIKKGQQLSSKDEDILYALYNLLAKESGYQYNVRKDIYMQSVWRRIKPGEQELLVEDSRSFAEEQIRILRDEKKKRLLKATERLKAEKQLKAMARSEVDQQVKQSREQRSLVRVQVQQKVEQSRVARAARRAQIHNLHELEKTTHPFTPVVEKNLQEDWTTYDADRVNAQSIAARIAQMDRSEQKNLAIIFRRRLEGEIQAYLDNHLQRLNATIKTVNRTLAVLAIKEFLLNNFEKPARNWAISNERLKVKELGITLTDVEPIVENCLEHLSQELAAAI